MSKVFIHATLSLDAFMARLDDDVSWGFKHDGDAMVDEAMQEIGAVVMGNRSFRVLTNRQTSI